MPLMFLAVFSAGYAAFWCYLVRPYGGRRELMRSRKGLSTEPQTRDWDTLPLITRYWMRLVPVLFAIAAVSLVAGIAIELQ